jgi:zinc protease
MTAPTRPTPGPSRPYSFPNFQHMELPNGLTVVVAPVRTLPLVTVLALVNAGADADPAGKEGVAQLTASLLVEGTKTLDGPALALKLEMMGSALDGGADWDSSVLRLTTTSTHLRAAIEQMAQVLREPALADDQFARLQQERLADLLQQRSEPRALADETFSHVLYAPGARYRKPDAGTEQSVGALSAADVREFHSTRYTAGNTTIVIAGDVDISDAMALVMTVLGDWSGERSAKIMAPDAAAGAVRTVHIVRKPDAPQSELRVGHVGPPRSTEDYFPLVLCNAILGGLFGSRLNLNLREEHAYTYGAHSTFDWRRYAGPFSMDAAVQSEVTAAAVTEILKEFDRMRAEPVKAEELSLAISYLDGVFPIRFETTRAIASALSSMVIYDLPMEYFDTYRAKVRAVTAADIQRVAQRYLVPEQLQILAVGDPAAIEAPLRALHVGEVVIHDADVALAG